MKGCLIWGTLEILIGWAAIVFIACVLFIHVNHWLSLVLVFGMISLFAGTYSVVKAFAPHVP